MAWHQLIDVETWLICVQDLTCLLQIKWKVSRFWRILPLIGWERRKMMIFKEFMASHIPNKVNLMNLLSSRSNWQKEIIEILDQSKIYSISVQCLQDVRCSSLMEQSSTIDWWSLWDLSTRSEGTMRFFHLMFSVPSYGKLVVTTSSIEKISSLFRKLMEKSTDSNLWTAQAIVLCLIWFRNHTELYLWGWLLLVSCIGINSKELFLDWQESEDSSKMMLIFSVDLIKLMLKY